MKILIVDDSKTMRMIVKRALRQAGFESHVVEEAGNGKEGLGLIQAAKPDVVLCDWNMPEMNGLELLHEVQRQAIPLTFGFVTSEGTPEMQQTALAAGARFVISKPFTAEAFQRELGPVLR
jgi:two-component system, chemotaxis family, chemotaxis protein CheY